MYVIGVLNPSSMILYIAIASVTRIIFTGRVFYYFALPITFFILISSYLVINNIIEYGPIFQIEKLRYTNQLWIGLVVYLVVPILIMWSVLFEVLLHQWKHREHLIQKLSYLDPLTNIANRRTINLNLDKLHQSKNSCYAIVLMDLDYFKQINDMHGHHTGDEVLIQVANTLKKQIRKGDLVGRFGGEEFILILPRINAVTAADIAERCRLAIVELQVKNAEDKIFSVTASFGVAESFADYKTQHILSQADKALYSAKASGRNRVHIFKEIESYDAT
ncbi:MAG: GGDEF domain-containing protein, partial [Acinetobacter sp.]